MKTQNQTSKIAALTLNAILILTLVQIAAQAGGPNRQVIAPNQPPPITRGYNADPDELTLAHGDYCFILGDVVFFDSNKARYIAVPIGYLMDELQSAVPLYLVTQVKSETYLIKQINPEVETVLAVATETKVDNGTARSL